MRLNIVKSKNAEQLYIIKSYRKEDGKSTTRIFKKLGTMQERLPEHNNDRDAVIAWAKEQARKYTEAEKQGTLDVSIDLSGSRQLEPDKMTTFNGGYLFLQKAFYELGIDKTCRRIQKKYRFKFDLCEIVRDLLYARILDPCSKRSTLEYCRSLLETPGYELHDVYRALDVLQKESSFIQASLYNNNQGMHNTSVLYYDCTNFFFETEEADGLRQYGRSKEHRPNPIVQMGLFMDGNGLPLALTVFPGNQNEQPSLIPLEKTVLSDFNLSRFIVCTDAGLASRTNRHFNNISGRSFIVTQSLKSLKKHLKEWALDPSGWRRMDDPKEYNLDELDEENHFRDIFFKERWINENGLEQRLIVSYSLKYREYQRSIRSRQIDRALKIIDQGKKKEARNQNDPRRFIEEQQMTMDGVLAELKTQALNDEKIAEEKRYDGFYAICTTLEDDIGSIIRINKRRWEIEESFRIMKSEFRSRPVYLQRNERIEAHFLTCFLSLLVYRTLEIKLDNEFTVREITDSMKRMKFRRIEGMGYIPCYTRNRITDALHKACGFQTDVEFISDKQMKKILKKTRS
ncbi:MAG: IS1634 family transposase [Eubacterium sp.]